MTLKSLLFALAIATPTLPRPLYSQVRLTDARTATTYVQDSATMPNGTIAMPMTARTIPARRTVSEGESNTVTGASGALERVA
jgi:hypothetical protein